MIANCKSRRDRVYRPALTLAFALIGSGAFALSDTDFQGAMNYDFRPPGARSLAMGGAFTAIADDATSALLNPAGLVQLRRPEFSLVGKIWTEDMHLDWGSGAYTDLSIYNPAFPKENRVERDYFNTRGAPAFLSFVYSFKRVTLGLYHAQTMEYNNTFVRDEIGVGPILIEDCTSGTCNTFPDNGFLSTALTQASGRLSHTRDIGLAAAIDLGHKFSLGLTGYLGHLKFQARSTRYVQGAVVSGRSATLIVDESSDEHAFGWGAGLLYAGDAWRFGVGYQKGESYTVRVTPQRGPRGRNLTLRQPFDTGLRVPDRATIAVAWRPTPLATVSAELEHIGWSKLTDNFRSFQPNLNSGNPEDPSVQDSGYKINDSLNPHLGLEYVVLADTSPLSLRVGAWWEQGHRLRYVGQLADYRIPIFPGFTIIFPGTSMDNGEKVLYPGGGSQQHYTAGIGFVAGKIQFDAGYDYAKWSRQFAVSTIIRF